ncbi:MAG: tetratricopeptide repeat protein, partial [Pseudomonadota bacterium]
AAARADFKQAIKIEPNFIPPYFNLARIDVAEEKIDSAMTQIEAVFDVDKDNSQAYIALGELATRVGKQELAIKYWSQARELDPGSGTARAALARSYRATGELLKAKEMIAEAYQVAPYQPLVQYEYAQIHVLTGNSAAAKPVIEKLQKRFPDSLRILELRVAAARASGNENELVDALTQVIALAPQSIKAHRLLVASYVRQELHEEARMVAKSLGEHEGLSSAALELGGDISYAKNELEQALSEYEEAFAIEPSTSVVLKLDQVERRLGKPSNRLAEWYEKNPDDRTLKFQLAANTHAKGKIEDARKTFEDLLAENPDNPVVLNNLAWIYHELGDERSLSYAERANKLSPGNAEIIDTYGWILLGNGKIERAIRLISEAVNKAPDNPDIRFHYAKALVEVGQENQAVEELSRILGEGKKQFASMTEAEALLQSLQDEG